jgi:5-methylcytosine-specific restriction enzyme A
MARNPKWTREELILALDLYVDHGILEETHPKVIDTSGILNTLGIYPEIQHQNSFRSPSAVALKLSNIARLDPGYPSKGMSAGGKLEIELWDEFSNDRERLRREAEGIRRRARRY